MKIRLISSIHSLPNVKKDNIEIELCEYPTENRSIKTIFRFFIKSFKFDYILLKPEIDLLFFAFLKLIFPWNKCKLISLDLILIVPQGFRGRISQLLRIVLLRKVSLFILFFRNIEGYKRFFRIKAEKVTYIPFKINSIEIVNDTEISDKGYIFCGGRSRRDFNTLIKVANHLSFPIKIVAHSNNQLRIHGSYIDKNTLPANVELIHDDGSARSFINYISNSRLVVLPIKKQNISASGISVYLVSMALKKCVILSAGPGVDDVLSEDIAIIVPPEDPEALRKAIMRAYIDTDYRKKFEINGYNYAMSLGGEQRLRMSIFDELRRYHVIKT